MPEPIRYDSGLCDLRFPGIVVQLQPDRYDQLFGEFHRKGETQVTFKDLLIQEPWIRDDVLQEILIHELRHFWDLCVSPWFSTAVGLRLRSRLSFKKWLTAVHREHLWTEAQSTRKRTAILPVPLSSFLRLEPTARSERIEKILGGLAALGVAEREDFYLPDFLLSLPVFGRDDTGPRLARFLDENPDTPAAFTAILISQYDQIAQTFRGTDFLGNLGGLVSPQSILEQIAIACHVLCSGLESADSQWVKNYEMSVERLMASAERIFTSSNPIFQHASWMLELLPKPPIETAENLLYLYVWSILGDPEDPIYAPDTRFVAGLSVLRQDPSMLDEKEKELFLDRLDAALKCKGWRNAQHLALYQTIQAGRWIKNILDRQTNEIGRKALQDLEWYCNQFAVAQVGITALCHENHGLLENPNVLRPLLIKMTEFIPVLITSQHISYSYHPTFIGWGLQEEKKRPNWMATDGRSCMLSAPLETAVNWYGQWQLSALADLVCGADFESSVGIEDYEACFQQLGYKLIFHDLH